MADIPEHRHGHCASFSAVEGAPSPGRAPSPGPDFTGMTPEEIKLLRSRAGERWSAAESEKIQELRNPPRSMPWKQISKVIGKTPLACRLRMNQIRKRKRIAAGELPEPRSKAGRKSPKSRAKQARKSSSPQPQRKLVPAEPQRPLPTFEPAPEISSRARTLPPLQSRPAPMYPTHPGQSTSYGWHGVSYQLPPPQQLYQASDRHNTLHDLAAHAANQAPLQGPTEPVVIARTAAHHGSAASAEVVSPQPQRKHSTIHGLLNPVAEQENA